MSIVLWSIGLCAGLLLFFVVFSFLTAIRQIKHDIDQEEHLIFLKEQNQQRLSAHEKNRRWREDKQRDLQRRHTHRETTVLLYEKVTGSTWQWHACGKGPDECTCIEVEELPPHRPGEFDIEL